MSQKREKIVNIANITWSLSSSDMFGIDSNGSMIGLLVNTQDSAVLNRYMLHTTLFSRKNIGFRNSGFNGLGCVYELKCKCVFYPRQAMQIYAKNMGSSVRPTHTACLKGLSVMVSTTVGMDLTRSVGIVSWGSYIVMSVDTPFLYE